MRKLLILMALMLFILPFVASVPPTSTAIMEERGIDIIHPETPYVNINEDLEINFWTYNSTSGQTITNTSANCTVYILNNKGVNYWRFSNQAGASGLIKYGKGAPLCTNCWTMTLPKGNLSLGISSYQIKCQGLGVGGYLTGVFEATPNGSSIRDNNTFLLGMIILLIGFAFFLYLIGTLFESFPPKLFFVTMAGVIFAFALAVGINGIQTYLYDFPNLLTIAGYLWYLLMVLVGGGLTIAVVLAMIYAFDMYSIKTGKKDDDDEY